MLRKIDHIKITLILLLLFVARLSFAVFSGGAGNGGDIISCPDREEKAFTLDSYEADKRKLTIDLVNPNIETQTLRSMVTVAVNRLMKKDEYLGQKLQTYTLEMVQDFEKYERFPDGRGQHVYLGNDVLVSVNDSLHVSTPEDCDKEPKQIVIQTVPIGRRDFRYSFNQTWWDMLSLQEKSMMILHEAWYRITLENGATDSRHARYMNGLVASREFESDSFSAYLDDLSRSEIKYYSILNTSAAVIDQEILIDLKNYILEFGEDEVCAPNFKVNMSIKETWSLLNMSQRYLQNTKLKKLCFKNSRITSMILPEKVINPKHTLRLPFHQFKFDKVTGEKPTLFFHTNGRLSHYTDFDFQDMFEMYYVCHGERSYINRVGCEAGPFNNHDTQIKNPVDIRFTLQEKPIGYFNRN